MIKITGLFYYDGYEIIAAQNMKIEGQFNFGMLKTLIFDERKEDYPLFNTLSELLELDKWIWCRLDCVEKGDNENLYYDIVKVKII